MSKYDHCKGCKKFVSHKHKKNLTEEQKRHDHWCCAKGQPALKSIALCKTHGLKTL